LAEAQAGQGMSQRSAGTRCRRGGSCPGDFSFDALASCASHAWATLKFDVTPVQEDVCEQCLGSRRGQRHAVD